MPFVQGESGNPAGRPPGSRNKATLLREAMLDAEGDELTRQMIALAKEGDRTALRLCMERVLPRGTSRPIEFPLPRVDSAAAARQAVADVIAAMTRGELAPREGHEMLRVINLGAKIIATAEMAEAAAREAQPQHIEVTWVDPKEKKEKWRTYWKRKYREAYEAQYGPLPDLPDPEEDGLLPRETAADTPARPADTAGAPRDADHGPPDRDAPPPPSPPPAATAGDGAGYNKNNENTGEPRKKPLRRPDPPEPFRSGWTVRSAGGVLPVLGPMLGAWRQVAGRLRQASGPAVAGSPPLVVAPA